MKPPTEKSLITKLTNPEHADKYLGYGYPVRDEKGWITNKQHDVSFIEGKQIKIPKGTMVHTTHPTIESGPSKTTRTVTVDHTICGSMISTCDVSRHDAHKSGYTTEELNFERELGWEERRRVREETGCHVYEVEDFYLIHSNPTVVWSGTGGYWFWVDINDIMEANGFSKNKLS